MKLPSLVLRCGHLIRCLLCLAVVSSLALGSECVADQEVAVLSYHDFPPFVINQSLGTGLTYELVRLLNEMGDDDTTYKLELMDRPSLDRVLAEGKLVIVPWVNPGWFNDADHSDHYWSESVLIDANVFVSNSERPVKYFGPASLRGLRLGGISGHRYQGVDSLVDGGEIERVDVSDVLACLELLAENRVDVILMPRSTLHYLARQLPLAASLYMAQKPHDTYERFLMVSQRDSAQAEVVGRFVRELRRSAHWRTTLQLFGLE